MGLITEISLVIGFISLIVFHEIGHAYFAKKEGIFKSFGLLPMPCCRMIRPYNNRWKYLSGILFSFVSLPFFIIALGIEFWWVVPILAFGSGALDLLVLIFYGKLKENKKNGISNFLYD